MVRIDYVEAPRQLMPQCSRPGPSPLSHVTKDFLADFGLGAHLLNRSGAIVRLGSTMPQTIIGVSVRLPLSPRRSGSGQQTWKPCSLSKVLPEVDANNVDRGISMNLDSIPGKANYFSTLCSHMVCSSSSPCVVPGHDPMNNCAKGSSIWRWRQLLHLALAGRALRLHGCVVCARCHVPRRRMHWQLGGGRDFLATRLLTFVAF